MLTVMAIMMIITVLVVFQQNKFSSATLLRSLTYSVALSVRQAQIYGTSVRGVSGAGGTTFGSGYGTYFSPTLACATGAAGSCYYLFADPSTGTSDGRRANDGSEDVKPPSPYSLGQGYVISKLCVQSGAATPVCTDSASPISSLQIFFRRPNPDACFSTDLVTNTCGKGQTPTYSAAYIQVKATGNSDTRSIKISSTGQIAVCNANLTDLTQC